MREKEDRYWVWIETGVNPIDNPPDVLKGSKRAKRGRLEGFDLASGFGIGRLEGREERIWRGGGFK